MGFGEAIKVCFNKYAVFSGRARRSEYWWFYLFMQLVYLPFAIIAGVLYGVSWGPVLAQADANGTIPESAFDDFNGTPMAIGIIIMVLVGLAFLLPSWAVLVRRLHDTGRSGWWILLSFVPFGGFVILVFTVLDSEPATNQYGPDPKAGDRWNGMPAAPAYPAAPMAQGAMPAYTGVQPENTAPQPPASQPVAPQPGTAAPQPPAAPPAAPPAQPSQETPPADPPAQSGGTDDPFAQPPR